MDVVVQTAEPSAPAATAHEELVAGFQAELEAERAPPKAEPVAEAPEIAEIEAAPDEAAPVEAEESEVEETEDTATAEADEGAETPTDVPPIAAPSGMTDADKAVYAKLPTELKAWVAKQAASRTADYTRKAQAIAEQKKAFDSTVPALMQRLEYFDRVLSEVTDNEIAPPDPAMRNTDPLAYDEALAQYMHQTHRKEVAAKERQKMKVEHDRLSMAARAEFERTRDTELREKAPEFYGPKGEEIGRQIQSYAKQVGYSTEQLMQARATDLITLWKAQQFDAIAAAKKVAKPVPPAPMKAAKPGPAKAVGRPSNLSHAIQALDKNPSRETLAQAFMAEIRSERR